MLNRINAVSAVERFARHEPMATDTKLIPRGASVSPQVVPKGTAYPEDVTQGDEVTLIARKIGVAVRMAEEDLADIPLDVIRQKQLEWATGYARFFDNATLGTTAAANGTTVPFESVYRAVSQGASGNLIATAGAVTYADFAGVIDLAEASDYANEGNTVIVAHPSFKGVLRGLMDSNNRPVFADNMNGATPNTLFGYDIVFTQGARTSATATETPAGNPLLIAGPRDLLIVGDRANAESVLIPGRDGASALTDETILKFRARKAFVTGAADAFGVIEVTSA